MGGFLPTPQFSNLETRLPGIMALLGWGWEWERGNILIRNLGLFVTPKIFFLGTFVRKPPQRYANSPHPPGAKKREKFFIVAVFRNFENQEAFFVIKIFLSVYQAFPTPRFAKHLTLLLCTVVVYRLDTHTRRWIFKKGKIHGLICV